MATRTISPAGGNYNSTGTWVEGIIPTLSDSIVSTATSGNLTVTDARAALSIDFTNYVGTFTVNAGVTLSMYGNLTFVAGMTIAGTGIIEFTANANLTSNGKIFTGSFSFSGSRTLTLLDDARIKSLSSPNAVMTTTINGFSLYTENFTNQNAPAWQGTTNLILNPAVSGTWSGSGTGGQLLFTNAIQINCAGTLTITGTLGLACGLTYIAGTVVASGASVSFVGAAKTLNLTSAVKFGSALQLTGTYTLTGELWFLGNVNYQGNSVFNGGTIYCGGNLTITNNINPSGTSVVVLNGTGSINQFNYPNSSIRVPITINTSGTYTLSSHLIVTANITHVSGTVNPNGKTLFLSNNMTLDTAGITWYDVVVWSYLLFASTITLNSSLNVSNQLIIRNYPTTFAGVFGFTASKFICETATVARTITFAAGVTYTVNNRLEVNGTSALPYTFASSSATVKAKLNLFGEQKVTHCNATRIDSSGGLTIYTSIARTLTDIINWGLGEGSWWPLLRKF